MGLSRYEILQNQRVMTGGQLFTSVCERYVIDSKPIMDMAEDLRKAFPGMLVDGYDLDRLQRLLNETRLPTIMGKPRWTMGELRLLTRG